LLDAAYASVASEIARQSRPELGKDSLAKKQGFRTPATLISATTGTSVGEAVRIVAVGDATAPRVTLTGEARPAKHPRVAEGLAAGRVGVPAASAIITMLDRVALRAAPGASEAMEKTLVDAAPGLTLDQLQKLIQRAEAHLDPDGVEPREQELYSDRSLTFREDRSGAIVLTGRFDPETAAPIKTVVEAMVGGMLRRRDERRPDGSRGGVVKTPGRFGRCRRMLSRR
jgi:5-methylcytosine-specific restriction protein A